MIQITYFLFFVTNAFAIFPSEGDVLELTSANFEKLVIDSTDIWLIEFYARWCSSCKQLVPEFTKAATALKGIAKVGAVNVDTDKSLGEKYNVDDFPTFFIFGADKNIPEEYFGDRTAGSFIDEILDAVKDNANTKAGIEKEIKHVIHLSDNSFNKLVLYSNDLWLVEFHAPWCEYCKTLAPHWEAAAEQLQGKVKLGAIDATIFRNKANEYKIEGYPTVKVFSPGNKDIDSVTDYNGGRTTREIVTWALAKLNEAIIAPKIIQLIDLESGRKACEFTNQCVVAVMPVLSKCNVKCRNGHLDMLKNLADRYKRKSWGWVWFESEAQPEIEKMLNMKPTDYPTIAVVNINTAQYAALTDTFNKDNVDLFLKDVANAVAVKVPVLRESMSNVLSTKSWNGKDEEKGEL